MTDKLLLSLKPQPAVGSPRRDNDRPAFALAVVCRNRDRAGLRQATDVLNTGGLNFRSKRQRLLHHAVGKLHPAYFGKAGIIFYLG